MNSMYRIMLIVYFVIHIPTTIIVDLQAIFADYYPEALRTFFQEQYIVKYGDFLMAAPPVWLKAMIYFELLQLPFFFVATYALVNKKNWIRIPAIIYGSHVTTTVSVILSEFYFSDKITTAQKTVLFSFYLPYLFIPLSITVYMALVTEPFGVKGTKKTK